MAVSLEPLLTRAERRETVYYLSDPEQYKELEDRYWRVRAREGRLLKDEEVRVLPEIAPEHPLAKEWAARADSLSRIANYVARQQHGMDVLDFGCGNGWLSHQLAALPNVRVYGLDLNRRELTQAARVFLGQPRLKFLYADIFTAPLPPRTFHIIVAASVIQYFADLPALVHRLLELCAPGGELHIFDSPLYQPHELEAARARSAAYYQAKRLEFMAETYHHHLWQTLAAFKPEVLYNPRTPLNRLAQWWWAEQPRSPFPWLKITTA